MSNPKKRRLSMSPTRGSQSDDSPEPKKRKSNTSAPASPAPAEPISAGRPKTRSPEPSASDSSATLEGDAPPPPSKDKGKGVERDPLVLERLEKEEVAQKDKLPKKLDEMGEVKKLLACSICSDPMYKPYVLVPCGHVTCYACLVLWFTSSHTDRHGDGHNPDVRQNSIEDHSDTGSSDSEPPDFDDSPSQRKGESNGSPLRANRLRHHRFPDCVKRDKTCPECRNLVVDRPVLLYVFRDLVDLVCGGRSVAKKRKDVDPWKGIFLPRPPGPGPGGGGGGPSGGGGGSRLRENGDDDDGALSEVEVDGPLRPARDGSARRRRENPSTLGLPSGFDEGLPGPSYIEHPQAPRVPEARPLIVDTEDNVRRCGTCLHELWHGECTNVECGIVYGDASPAHSEAGSSVHDHDDEDEEDMFLRPQGDEHYIDDGYESSFIDDEEHRNRHYEESEYYVALDVEEDGSDNDDFIPGPSQRWLGRRGPIAISSDEDNRPGPSRLVRRPRRGRQIVDDEELEVENGSVENGSSPFRLEVAITGAGSRSPATPSESQPVIEDNDYAENYTDVLYPWEQENDGDNEEEQNPDDGTDDG